VAEGVFQIRPITAHDDPAVRDIIQIVMPEFGANGAGFALHDAEVHGMSAAYSLARHVYFVVTIDGMVLGGAGVAPLVDEICELRKMYFLPKLRGLGAGAALMQQCLDAAKTMGYGQIYLETLTGMDRAFALYEGFGFQRLNTPMGNTGHFGCNRFYLRSL
jgi:putative acetyltransferase